MNLIVDLQKLIADVRAQSYWQAFLDGLKVAADISAMLSGTISAQGKKKFATAPTDLEGCCKAIEAEIASGDVKLIPWASVLAFVMQMLHMLFPMIP